MATFRQTERFNSALFNQFPGYVYNALRPSRGGTDSEYAELVEMWERRKEFPNPKAAVYAAIFNNPRAYKQLDKSLTKQFDVPTGENNFGEVPAKNRLVIVGSGINAAIFAAAWFKRTGQKAVVLESSKTVGGKFGMTSNPAFRLNSRNRAGEVPGFPGTGAALNVIPGAIVQPSDLNADEYQFNNALGYAIRLTLAEFATVYTETEVLKIERGERTLLGGEIYKDTTITLGDGKQIQADRVIVATGIGKEMRYDVEGVQSYSQFLSRVDTEQFPMRGIKRVAVIGAGDGGKTVVEALIGQGPRMGMSVMSLDRPERIDWFGCTTEFGDLMTKQLWRNANRSRYDGIARALPREAEDIDALVRPRLQAADVNPSGAGARVDGRVYDLVVDCRGYLDSAQDTGSLVYDLEANKFGPEQGSLVSNPKVQGLAKKLYTVPAYIVGPAARLPLTPEERSLFPTGIPENTAAIFRYADRTAQLAKVID